MTQVDGGLPCKPLARTSPMPMNASVVGRPKGFASSVSLRDGVAEPDTHDVGSILERAKNATKRQKLIAAACLFGVVMVSAIGASAGGGQRTDPTKVAGPLAPVDIDIDAQAEYFTNNYTPDVVVGGTGNSTNNGTGDGAAGYLERCNPGYGFGGLDAPDCEDGLVCVTDNHFSSWCMTCDTEPLDRFTLQCGLANPQAVENLAIACGEANPIGCNAAEYAGRDERCNPEDGTNKFSDFRPCVPGLQCVTSTDNEYTQCVVCQDPFWSEDCVFWKPVFRDAAMSTCGTTECKHREKAGRDERCSPTPEHEQFGQFPSCATGLRCVTTAFYSQCVSCTASAYLTDCQFWQGDFKAQAAATCAGAPDCGNELPTVAQVGDRCRRDVGDLQFIGYPECIDSSDDSDPVVCATTEHYSQCIRCGDLEADCSHWTPLFLQAAEEACGFDAEGCAVEQRCTNGRFPDANGNCVLVGNGEACVADGQTVDGTSSEGPVCKQGLKCVTSDSAKQCVDCSDQFLYDCVYWEPSFLEEAEAQCQRDCVALTFESGECASDDECGSESGDGWACVATAGYSQCVQCGGDQFSYDCGYWTGSFLEAAELRCGLNCEPKTCPHDRTPAPTAATSASPATAPTNAPSMLNFTATPTDSVTASLPTSSPTHAPSKLDSTKAPTQARVMNETTPEPTQFPSVYVSTDAPTKAPSMLNSTATPTDSVTASLPTSSPNKAPSTLDPTETPTSTPSSPPPTTSPSNAPSTLAPTKAPTQAPSSILCFERYMSSKCEGVNAFINDVNEGEQRKYLIASEDECEAFCLGKRECGGFEYYEAGVPFSGGFNTGADGRRTRLVGAGACFFFVRVDNVSSKEGSRCYNKFQSTVGEAACTTKGPTASPSTRTPTRTPTKTPTLIPTSTELFP